jgi:hypothetical protein
VEITATRWRTQRGGERNGVENATGWRTQRGGERNGVENATGWRVPLRFETVRGNSDADEVDMSNPTAIAALRRVFLFCFPLVQHNYTQPKEGPLLGDNIFIY